MSRSQPKQRERIVKNNHRLAAADHKAKAVGGHSRNQQSELRRQSVIQARLHVGASNDKYEQEADAVARRVVSMPSQPVFIQRKCRSCGTAIQTKSLVQRQCAKCESRIDSMRSGGGRPMERSRRDFFESRMGYDFSDVRLHIGPDAQSTAKDLGAKAYTAGRDIAFGKGQYQPDTTAGKELPAHELTHTV